MSQMRVALGAANFGPHHAELRIPMLHHVAGLPGFVETRPARPGVEFGLGIEQWRAAAHAVIHSRLFRVPIPPGKRTLGARLAGHVILLVAKLLFPLGFGLGNFLCRLFGHVDSISIDRLRYELDVSAPQKWQATFPLLPPPSDTSRERTAAARLPAPPRPRPPQ